MMFPFPQNKKKKPDFLDPDEILADSLNSLGSGSHTENKIERPLARVSSVMFIFLAVLALAYLVARAYGLQIRSGSDFFSKSQQNRFLARVIFPPRGIISDHYGNILVENIPSFGLVFSKEEFIACEKRSLALAPIDIGARTREMRTRPCELGDVSAMLRKLSGILAKPLPYFYGLGFSADGNLSGLPPKIFITQDLKREQALAVMANLNDLPGIEIFENYRRNYLAPYAYSHALGFVGKVSQEDLAKTPQAANFASVGKSGIELFYEDILRGSAGKKIVEVDSLGRETRFREAQEPQDGKSVQLHLDGALQQVVYRVLEARLGGKKGASVVALDPRNGATRALVSYPGFDSNSFGFSLDPEDFAKVLANPLKPMFNRAVSGEFPSGSVIKPVIASAALAEKIIDPEKRIYDPGYIEIPHPYRPGEVSRFLDWRPQGSINMYDALAFSANVYFYIIGGGFKDQPGLGIERVKKYVQEFGLGSKLGIDLPNEKSGFFPDPDSKKISEPNDPVWRVGDTYNVSIGQGGVKLTPLQIAAMTSVFANGGTLYRPRLLEKVLDSGQNAVKETAPEILRSLTVSPEILEIVRKGMRQAVTGGTAKVLDSLLVPVAAKTGTAEAGSGRPHAWITVIAPYENPELVLTVMVEHGGEGSSVAAPIAKDILQMYFSNRRE